MPDPPEHVGGLSRRRTRPQLSDDRFDASGPQPHEQLPRAGDHDPALVPEAAHERGDCVLLRVLTILLQARQHQRHVVIVELVLILALDQGFSEHRCAHPAPRGDDGLACQRVGAAGLRGQDLQSAHEIVRPPGCVQGLHGRAPHGVGWIA